MRGFLSNLALRGTCWLRASELEVGYMHGEASLSLTLRKVSGRFRATHDSDSLSLNEVRGESFGSGTPELGVNPVGDRLSTTGSSVGSNGEVQHGELLGLGETSGSDMSSNDGSNHFFIFCYARTSS
jgi:hypothetical protein